MDRLREGFVNTRDGSVQYLYHVGGSFYLYVVLYYDFIFDFACYFVVRDTREICGPNSLNRTTDQ